MKIKKMCAKILKKLILSLLYEKKIKATASKFFFKGHKNLR